LGREFVFVAVRQTWGEDRVFFFADDGTQKCLPRAWTDAADVDPFVALAAGRSPFRVEDLLLLAELVGARKWVVGAELEVRRGSHRAAMIGA
jgi:hypothetical protein